MRRYKILASLLAGLVTLQCDTTDGFSHGQIHPVHDGVSMYKIRRRSCEPVFATKGTSNEDVLSSCPFTKNFPKYRIDFTRVDKQERKSGFNLVPFVGDIQKTLGKGQIEEKFRGPEVDWLEGDDVSAISVFTKLWKAASQISEESHTTTTTTNHRIVVGLTDSCHFAVAQRWLDIFNWMQSEKAAFSLGNAPIDATIHKEGKLLAVELIRQGGDALTSSKEEPADTEIDAAALDKRTQAWVKRILVDQGICPFTKSVKVSGQGLGDLGIPVAKIHYCSSNASTNQISKLMADTWTEIAYMLEMGPSGREGISSILLAAPQYDNDFDLWSGPVFAMLESGVVACGLESQVGVVCFHPRYATPDGKSFPGFGHMHSVPRLKKWLGEHDANLQDKLSDEEIAAGGAWQRRTPHATINVLRAEQLQAAEGRRVTGELYSENIAKLVGKPDGIGSDKLLEDLEKERSLR